MGRQMTNWKLGKNSMAAGGKRLEKELQQLRRDDQKKVADGLDFDIKLFPNVSCISLS